MSKKYKAVTTVQGNAVLAKHAYVAKASEDIICMYLDACGDTGREYPTASSSSWNPTTGETYPVIWYEATDEDESYTQVEFPELVGWEIFSVGGGKTCEIVLTKGKLFE